MPDYSDCYGGRFVKAADITKPFNGTIERAERTEVEKGRPKIVVYFEGRDKGFVLNATISHSCVSWRRARTPMTGPA